MKLKLIGLIVISLCVYSCKYEKKYIDAEKIYWKDFGKEKQLIGERLYCNDELQKPIRMFLEKNVMYLSNLHTESLLQIMDLDSERTIGEYIPFGSGPDEMLSISRIQKVDSLLYLYDSMKQRIEVLSIVDYNINHLYSMNYSNYFEDFGILSDNNIVSLVVDVTPEKLFYFKGDSLLKNVGEYPQINTKEEMSELEKISGFASSLAVNLSKDRIVVVHKQTDLIEIYNIEGKLFKRIHGPDHFFPIVNTKKRGEYQTLAAEPGKSRDAYFYPVPDDELFYVLYSGKAVYPELKNYLNDWVLVFDWDGNPVTRYKLEEPIYGLALDAENRILYGLSDSPEYHVLRYKID